MALKDRIAEELKTAMRAKDQVRVDTLRSALSAFSYRKIEAGRELADDEQIEVVRKLVKQRVDSIEQFEKGGRMDLVEKETREREILATLVPAQKSAEELRPLVRDAVVGLPPDQRNQGAAMKVLLPQLKGQADGNTIRKLVLEELGRAG
ncbi:MAG: GatB/YqeY domain-containing protein [Candidatus Eremiobacteraeota bacterium]|nr:GatB/YqeY domain-containing protein [Candidatus Eremiobacteraeota bacterium]